MDACRWSSLSVPHAPYVTSLPWISHYGCYYVVHGDDITSDSSGEDCYRYVKAAGRFMVVKRTPDISTTDLVGRMLLCTRSHFIKSLTKTLAGKEGPGNLEERKELGEDMRQRIKDYASDETGLHLGSQVWRWAGSKSAMEDHTAEEAGFFISMVAGKPPRPDQRVVYVDGGFDLFSSGHIEFLRQVVKAEEQAGKERGWYDETARKQRLEASGQDYPPAYVVAGVHDDEVINRWKGVNYPIMNIFERGLCVLQCRVSPHLSRPNIRVAAVLTSTAKYIHAVIFSAPFTPTKSYLSALPYGTPSAVYHGPTSFMPLTYDPYSAPKDMGIYHEIGGHDFQNVNAGEIVQRIMRSREMYEERQRIKAEKGIAEEAARQRESTALEAT